MSAHPLIQATEFEGVDEPVEVPHHATPEPLATVRSPTAEVQAAASNAGNLVADAALGRLIRAIIDEAGGDGFATRDALIQPTMPGTPERKLQDRAEAAFSRRVRALVKGEGE